MTHFSCKAAKTGRIVTAFWEFLPFLSFAQKIIKKQAESLITCSEYYVFQFFKQKFYAASLCFGLEINDKRKGRLNPFRGFYHCHVLLRRLVKPIAGLMADSIFVCFGSKKYII